MTPKKLVQHSENTPVWGRRIASPAGMANVAYCAGWDVRQRDAADLELLPWDIQTNRAHCVMLAQCDIISDKAIREILVALEALEERHSRGDFNLDPNLEDVHLNVEKFVEQQAGPEVAGLMHTARSRNDQVATDMRLWLRAKTLFFLEETLDLIVALEKLARRHLQTLMPGITHHQPAAWSTFGHWCMAHAYAFQRDAESLLQLLEAMNLSPLGAAASYGTSWPIDRNKTARYLGFTEPQRNSLDCVTNRSEFEARAAASLALWCQHAATLSQDMILFSSPPWQLFRIDDAFVTGSSIMPQKRNPDFAEVTKAKASLVGHLAAGLLDLTRGDPSGYNREQQWAKYMIQQIFHEIDAAPRILAGAAASLQLDKSRMQNLLQDDYLEAADAADFLAQTRDVPFRFAYQWLGKAVRLSEEQHRPLMQTINNVLEEEEVRPLNKEEKKLLASPQRLLERRNSLGGPEPKEVQAQAVELRMLTRGTRQCLTNFRRKVRQGEKKLAKAIAQYRMT